MAMKFKGKHWTYNNVLNEGALTSWSITVAFVKKIQIFEIKKY